MERLSWVECMMPSESTWAFTRAVNPVWDSWPCVASSKNCISTPRSLSNDYSAATYGGRTARSPSHPDRKSRHSWLPEAGTATPDSPAFSGSTLGEADSKSFERLAGFQEASGRDWHFQQHHNLGFHCNPVQCRGHLPESSFSIATSTESARSQQLRLRL